MRQAGLLVLCQLPWNTPLLPVKKPGTNDFHPVQDLREINKRVEDIHPTVPNPYTLLTYLPPDRVVYTILDLKDAFFSLPLAASSQLLFAFEWRDLEDGLNGQLTWTRLPQGFKNSLTIFDKALHKDLKEVTYLGYKLKGDADGYPRPEKRLFSSYQGQTVDGLSESSWGQWGSTTSGFLASSN